MQSSKPVDPDGLNRLNSEGLLLHVGCGPCRLEQTPFAGMRWRETRLDLDAGVNPDVVAGLTEMGVIQSESVDAVFSSHNIEHLYFHEVPRALAEFRRVLKPSGVLLLTCPDLQSIAALIAADRLADPAYVSSLGPITPLDMVYGHRTSMENGNLYMAHRTGFTKKVLISLLRDAGFRQAACVRRESAFDLWILATVTAWSSDAFRDAARWLMPKS